MRYFHCGEYGETTGRPHYHAVLFGVRFEDQKEVVQGPGKPALFTSRQLDRLWQHGDCRIGAVTFESASYVARYCVKNNWCRGVVYNSGRYAWSLHVR